MPNVIHPTISTNGSDPGDLLSRYEAAGSAAHAALTALCNAAPNARDYAPGQWAAAKSEHEDRMARLRAVRDELMELADAL